MKNFKMAVRWEVSATGGIQLFGEDGEKLPGTGTRWDGNFDCADSPGLISLEGAP